ncbi:MAG TPA: phosphatidylglycerol lysyltransferase domain-containing protein [Bacteroidales bacterium]|nr:phosphatidylglycerol lysyltransferase domain-containing protein [Bacteroidales bacterium]
MREFSPLSVTDRSFIIPFLKNANKQSSEFSFTALYMWAGIYNTTHATVPSASGPLLIFRSRKEESDPYAYLYPLAENGEEFSAEEAVRIIADLSPGEPFSLWGLSEQQAGELRKAFPGQFDISPVRSSFDYLYPTSQLVLLGGKKLQPKRNLISSFKRLYPDFLTENITADNIAECLKMNDEWCVKMGCRHNAALSEEKCAVHRTFYHFQGLELEGLLLRAEGRIVAFTVGEPLSSDTYIVHIEKAFPEYKGSYQAINQLFAEYVQERHPDLIYINREDDAGDEGLRKAKLSYQPVSMVEKYAGFFNPLTRP